jgi:RHS repeat-associated protein
MRRRKKDGPPAYDQFNRLVCANLSNGTCASPTNGTATYTYNYDRFGNRWHQNGTSSSSVSFTGNNNRMDSYSYDAAGDLLNDGAHSYAYDGYGEIASVDGGNTANYYYDAEGRRVRKNLAGSITDYIYNLQGQEIAEFDGSGNWLRGEAFVSGRYHIATYTNGATYFDHADWLGTERARTPVAGGAPCETITSLPFGDGEVDTGSCEGTRTRHFTGKERDSESGLDNFGARYNASTMGRFMTPDSVSYSNRKNPQSWNLYAYALNNPVSFRDADGHEIVCANNAAQCQKDAATATGNAEAAKRVTTNTVTTDHSFLGIHWTTSKTTIAITGDMKSFSALSPNAAKLGALVQDSRTVTVSYDNVARQSGWDTGLRLNGGSTSYMNPFLAIIDPSRTAGAVYDPDAVDQKIPQANTAEEFGHEVLGHIWGDMLGGAPAGTRANMRDSIIGEDAVRALDPTRGQKGLESHHNYQEMPPDPPKQ